MLPSWIIEEIKRRELDWLRRDERPRVELPLEPPPSSQHPSTPPREDRDRDRDGDRQEDGAGIVIDLA